MSNGLILFTKNPRLGHVKTRLAKDIGDHQALDVYKQLINYTRSISTSDSWDTYVFYDQKIITADDWSTDLYQKRVQHGDDLGHRMKNAFNEVLDYSDAAIIIGSDCGVLTLNIIEKAFIALSKNDVVIGPTEDGGYYLLGMKVRHPYLFDNIKWSSEEVFSETMKVIRYHNLSCCVLDQLYDVDYKSDWERLLLDQGDYFTPAKDSRP